jgi:hypothetical protein
VLSLLGRIVCLSKSVQSSTFSGWMKKTAEIYVKSICQLISTQNVSKQGPNLRNWIASKQWIFSWIWRLPHQNDKEIICESLPLRRVLYVIPTWLRISLSSCTSRRFTHTHSWLSHCMSYWWHLLKNSSPLIVDPAEIMWLKQCHKLPMTGNGANIKMVVWGTVCYCFNHMMEKQKNKTVTMLQ